MLLGSLPGRLARSEVSQQNVYFRFVLAMLFSRKQLPPVIYLNDHLISIVDSTFIFLTKANSLFGEAMPPFLKLTFKRLTV